MAEIGDKSFTTDMIQLIKDAVKAELGTNAYVNRYLAEITAVNTTTSEVSVKLSGSDTASDSFRVRGIHLPEVGQQVVACIDGQDRWIESVIRPTTSTPYLTFSTVAAVPAGSVVAWLTGTAPTGWLFCDGTSYAYNTYPALGAILGGSPGGNFTTPDMRDRFIGTKSTIGTWSNTSQTTQFGPSTEFPIDRGHTHPIDPHTHIFTGNAHTHGAGTYNPTATTIGSITSSSDSHSHTVDPASVTSGAPSAGGTSPTGSGSSAATSAHTHSVNIGSTTSSSDGHSHTTTVSSHDHGINGSSESITASGTNANNTLGIDTDTPEGGITWDPYPKSTLLNFIIKT